MKCDITENIPKINDKGADLHTFHQSPCLKGKKMASQSIRSSAWALNFDGLCLVLETSQINGFHCSNNIIVLHKTTNKKNPKTHIIINEKIKLVTNH